MYKYMQVYIQSAPPPSSTIVYVHVHECVSGGGSPITKLAKQLVGIIKSSLCPREDIQLPRVQIPYTYKPMVQIQKCNSAFRTVLYSQLVSILFIDCMVRPV